MQEIVGVIDGVVVDGREALEDVFRVSGHAELLSEVAVEEVGECCLDVPSDKSLVMEEAKGEVKHRWTVIGDIREWWINVML